VQIENIIDYKKRNNIALEEDYGREVLNSKTKYTKFDFLDHCEAVRFTTPYLMYKSMNWWPVYDFIAMYGHLFSFSIVTVMAVHFHVTFFMGFNVLCVCFFYAYTTYRISKKAYDTYQFSGLQS